MPIVDVRVVAEGRNSLPEGAARAVAEALAGVFQAPPGRVWVRLDYLSESQYAENGSAERHLPAFVQVLVADLPAPAELASQAAALAAAVAGVLRRNREQVHVEYALPGRGRVAFGGVLLR